MSINTIIKNLHTKVYNDIYNTEVFIFDKNLKLIELKEYLNNNMEYLKYFRYSKLFTYLDIINNEINLIELFLDETNTIFDNSNLSRNLLLSSSNLDELSNNIILSITYDNKDKYIFNFSEISNDINREEIVIQKYHLYDYYIYYGDFYFKLFININDTNKKNNLYLYYKNNILNNLSEDINTTNDSFIKYVYKLLVSIDNYYFYINRIENKYILMVDYIDNDKQINIINNNSINLSKFGAFSNDKITNYNYIKLFYNKNTFYNIVIDDVYNFIFDGVSFRYEYGILNNSKYKLINDINNNYKYDINNNTYNILRYDTNTFPRFTLKSIHNNLITIYDSNNIHLLNNVDKCNINTSFISNVEIEYDIIYEKKITIQDNSEVMNNDKGKINLYSIYRSGNIINIGCSGRIVFDKNTYIVLGNIETIYKLEHNIFNVIYMFYVLDNKNIIVLKCTKSFNIIECYSFLFFNKNIEFSFSVLNNIYKYLIQVKNNDSVFYITPKYITNTNISELNIISLNNKRIYINKNINNTLNFNNFYILRNKNISYNITYKKTYQSIIFEDKESLTTNSTDITFINNILFPMPLKYDPRIDNNVMDRLFLNILKNQFELNNFYNSYNDIYQNRKSIIGYNGQKFFTLNSKYNGFYSQIAFSNDNKVHIINNKSFIFDDICTINIYNNSILINKIIFVMKPTYRIRYKNTGIEQTIKYTDYYNKAQNYYNYIDSQHIAYYMSGMYSPKYENVDYPVTDNYRSNFIPRIISDKIENILKNGIYDFTDVMRYNILNYTLLDNYNFNEFDIISYNYMVLFTSTNVIKKGDLYNELYEIDENGIMNYQIKFKTFIDTNKIYSLHFFLENDNTIEEIIYTFQKDMYTNEIKIVDSKEVENNDLINIKEHDISFNVTNIDEVTIVVNSGWTIDNSMNIRYRIDRPETDEQKITIETVVNSYNEMYNFINENEKEINENIKAINENTTLIELSYNELLYPLTGLYNYQGEIGGEMGGEIGGEIGGEMGGEGTNENDLLYNDQKVNYRINNHISTYGNSQPIEINLNINNDTGIILNNDNITGDEYIIQLGLLLYNESLNIQYKFSQINNFDISLNTFLKEADELYYNYIILRDKLQIENKSFLNIDDIDLLSEFNYKSSLELNNSFLFENISSNYTFNIFSCYNYYMNFNEIFYDKSNEFYTDISNNINIINQINNFITKYGSLNLRNLIENINIIIQEIKRVNNEQGFIENISIYIGSKIREAYPYLILFTYNDDYITKWNTFIDYFTMIKSLLENINKYKENINDITTTISSFNNELNTNLKDYYNNIKIIDLRRENRYESKNIQVTISNEVYDISSIILDDSNTIYTNNGVLLAYYPTDRNAMVIRYMLDKLSTSDTLMYCFLDSNYQISSSIKCKKITNNLYKENINTTSVIFKDIHNTNFNIFGRTLNDTIINDNYIKLVYGSYDISSNTNIEELNDIDYSIGNIIETDIINNDIILNNINNDLFFNFDDIDMIKNNYFTSFDKDFVEYVKINNYNKDINLKSLFKNYNITF